MSSQFWAIARTSLPMGLHERENYGLFAMEIQRDIYWAAKERRIN
jgi:hypothetical protein